MSRAPERPTVRAAIPEMPWSEQAACRTEGASRHLFFPNSKQNLRVNPDAQQAIAICNRCPVQRECLQHAVDHEPYGIWGGSYERDREGIRYAARLPCLMPHPGGNWNRLIAASAEVTVEKFRHLLADHQIPKRQDVA